MEGCRQDADLQPPPLGGLHLHAAGLAGPDTVAVWARPPAREVAHPQHRPGPARGSDQLLCRIDVILQAEVGHQAGQALAHPGHQPAGICNL